VLVAEKGGGGGGRGRGRSQSRGREKERERERERGGGERKRESGTVTVTMPGRHDGGWYGSSRQPESRLAEADCLSIAPPLSSSSLLCIYHSLSLSLSLSLLLLSPFPTSPAVGR